MFAFKTIQHNNVLFSLLFDDDDNENNLPEYRVMFTPTIKHICYRVWARVGIDELRIDECWITKKHA